MDFATFSLTTKSRVRVSDMVVRILLAVYWIQLDCVVPGFPFEDPLKLPLPPGTAAEVRVGYRHFN